jgi:hypothetical protein
MYIATCKVCDDTVRFLRKEDGRHRWEHDNSETLRRDWHEARPVGTRVAKKREMWR